VLTLLLAEGILGNHKKELALCGGFSINNARVEDGDCLGVRVIRFASVQAKRVHLGVRVIRFASVQARRVHLGVRMIRLASVQAKRVRLGVRMIRFAAQVKRTVWWIVYTSHKGHIDLLLAILSWRETDSGPLLTYRHCYCPCTLCNACLNKWIQPELPADMYGHFMNELPAQDGQRRGSCGFLSSKHVSELCMPCSTHNLRDSVTLLFQCTRLLPFDHFLLSHSTQGLQ
jgi:hypothetical protein